MKITYIGSIEFFGITTLDGLNEESLKKIYHKLAQKYHPDKGGNAQDFIKLRQAYFLLRSILTNPNKDTKQENDQYYDVNEELKKYKEIYNSNQQTISKYKDIFNKQIGLINQTQNKIKQIVYNYNKNKENLENLLYNKLNKLNEKYNRKWWEHIIKTRKLTESQFQNIYNSIVKEHNETIHGLEIETFQRVNDVYQEVFSGFIDSLSN